MPTPFTDDEFRLFSEWLVQEYGLHFGPEKREILRARLEPRRAELNLPTFERLLFHVRYHPQRDEERLRLLSRLTNNESYFFRERNQLDELRERVLPELAQQVRRGDRSELRVMSVGSASGEEVYTLAIICQEALGRHQSPVIITGVDVDVDALERARAALYRKHALRGVEDPIRNRYFEEQSGGLWQLDPRIQSAARFEHGNLVDPEWPETVDPQDVVFCRNVLIYFDEQGVKRAVENLYRVVRPGGYLFLGHAESLSRIPTRFVAQRRPGSIYYRKPEE